MCSNKIETLISENPSLQYKNGFYEFKYHSGTPQQLIDSFSILGKNGLLDQQRSISVNNKFIKGHIYYLKLETGFWVFCSQLFFKKSIWLKSDATSNNNFYLLSTVLEVNKTIAPKLTPGKPNSWCFKKPGIGTNTACPKGNALILVDFMLDKNWLQENIAAMNNPAFIPIKKFLLSANTTGLKADNLIGSCKNIAQLIATFPVLGKSKANENKIKKTSLELVNKYFKHFGKQPQLKTLIHKTDKQKMEFAEKILANNITIAFPGIKHIAKTVHVSPNKLKANFKSIYGKPLFQYFLEKQMLFAHQTLETEDILVKEVAIRLGYKHAGKFTEAFKRYFGYKPSFVSLRNSLIEIEAI